MKALFVAFQDPSSRRWAPVAKLTRTNGGFEFVYTRGAEELGFEPFREMPHKDRIYYSKELFPIFANRVLAKSRPEYAEYLKWLGLTVNSDHPFHELALTGGVRATDPLELILAPERTADGKYEVLFFCRGLQHFPPSSRERVGKLLLGEKLFLAKDIQNPNDPNALMLRSADPVTLCAYVPRYYADDFLSVVDAVGRKNVEVSVERINAGAPLNYRALCRFSAPWPTSDTFLPCNRTQYLPIETRHQAVVA